MAIYTKKGDKGTTSLFTSDKKTWIIPKHDLRVRAIGAIDETNTFVGLSMSFIENEKVKRLLAEVQEDLFLVGAVLAGANVKFYNSKTKKLEALIDVMESELPILKNFILPGGSRAGSFLFNARVVARRAEREVSSLNKKEPVRPQVLTFVNRLSDFLFVLARKINNDLGVSEVPWVGEKSK